MDDFDPWTTPRLDLSDLGKSQRYSRAASSALAKKRKNGDRTCELSIIRENAHTKESDIGRQMRIKKPQG